MLPWPWHIFLVREHMSHFEMIHIFMVDKTYKYYMPTYPPGKEF